MQPEWKKVEQPTFKILTHTRKAHLGRPSRRWEDKFEIDLQEIGINTRNWVELTQDRDYWSPCGIEPPGSTSLGVSCYSLCIFYQILKFSIVLLRLTGHINREINSDNLIMSRYTHHQTNAVVKYGDSHILQKYLFFGNSFQLLWMTAPASRKRICIRCLVL